METEASYIYKPDTITAGERSAKRRKSGHVGEIASKEIPFKPLFTPLLHGAEAKDTVNLRHEGYVSSWTAQRDKISDVVQGLHIGTFNEICDFVESGTAELYEDKLPAGIILTGPGIASYGQLFVELSGRIKDRGLGATVILTSAASPNVKVVIKNIIQSVISSDFAADDDDNTTTGHLNYDLRILQDFVLRQKLGRITIAFQDTEAFDGGVLAEIVFVLSSWIDRVPFVLLFGVATSLDIFQNKLPKAAVQLMQGQKFDVAGDDELFEEVFKASLSKDSRIYLGPNLCDQMIARQRDQVQSVQNYVHGLNYAYMCHFYANPLSFLSLPNTSICNLQKEHLRAIRCFGSFKRHVEDLVERDETIVASRLLDDDDFLRETIHDILPKTRTSIESLIQGLELVDTTRPLLIVKSKIGFADLYRDSLSGDFMEHAIVRELLLHIRTMSSDTLVNLMDAICLSLQERGQHPNFLTELATLKEDLEAVRKRAGASGLQIRNKHDIKVDTSRSTAVSRKAETDLYKLTLSKSDAAYAKVVSRFYKAFQNQLQTSFCNLRDLLLYEVYVYDLRSPHRETFNPTPRQATEQALMNPHHYLSCNCCEGSEGVLVESLPPTAILYRLVLDSGALINIWDLWTAFHAMVGGESDEDRKDPMTRALFYRGLAEIKMLGMVRQSKKKPDHIARLIWPGL